MNHELSKTDMRAGFELSEISNDIHKKEIRSCYLEFSNHINITLSVGNAKVELSLAATKQVKEQLEYILKTYEEKCKNSF